MASKLPKESQAVEASWIKSVLDPHGYGLAIVVALVLHIVVIGLFAIEWPKEKRVVAEPTPRNIQAKVIQTESKKVKQQRLAKKKREEQRIKNENWKKHLAKKKADKQKAAKAEKLRKDLAKKDKAKKEKARKDKIKKENAKKALAKQKAADALKLKKAQELEEEKLKEEQAFEREQEEALLEALADEEQQRSIEKALADEQLAQKNAAITDDIASQIKEKVSRAWNFPPSARPDMEVVVRIQLVPTGEVINVSIISSSGNEALDRSVLAAVKRAQPLPVPKDIRLFEQQFRNFRMPFRPEGAVW